MNGLKRFFDEERKRVIEPGPFFTERVLARIDQGVFQDSAIWEMVPGSTRPVFAVALMLMLCFIFVEVFLPQTPQRGLIESYLESEQNPAESFLYVDSDVPSEQEVFEQMIGLGDPLQ
jgi:hypothetical protein